MSEQTEFPAKYVVFWPGQEVKACEKHFQGLQSLNTAMGGAPLASRLLEEIGESGECSNCKNESKKWNPNERIQEEDR